MPFSGAAGSMMNQAGFGLVEGSPTHTCCTSASESLPGIESSPRAGNSGSTVTQMSPASASEYESSALARTSAGAASAAASSEKVCRWREKRVRSSTCAQWLVAAAAAPLTSTEQPLCP